MNLFIFTISFFFLNYFIYFVLKKLNILISINNITPEKSSLYSNLFKLVIIFFLTVGFLGVISNISYYFNKSISFVVIIFYFFSFLGLISFFLQQKNQSIDLKIEDLKSEQYLLDDKLEDTKLASTNVFGNIQVLKNKEKQINENIDKVEQLEGDYQAYQYLLNAIQRDGVPYDLISKSLPTVEGAVNDILAQIVDFSVVFSMNGKDIDTHIVYDDDRVWSLELSSGMERFISSLAIRIGLMNVSNLPQGNFLAIDEGWGTMDSDNLNSVAQLFQYLKSQFQFTFVVSHIETMRDFVDTLLEIKKIDGSSSVRFSR